MTDLELSQQALPFPDGVFNYSGQSFEYFSRSQMLDMFLAGMAKAREIDAGICDRITQHAKQDSHTPYTSFGMGSDSCAYAIRSQGKK
jgi:hypothetical protein